MNTNQPIHLLRARLSAPAIADIRPTVLDLPFVRETRSKRCFWDVEPTGRPNDDYLIGISYALEAITYLRKTGSPSLLTHVVAAMPRKIGELEDGFLYTIGEFITLP